MELGILGLDFDPLDMQSVILHSTNCMFGILTAMVGIVIHTNATWISREGGGGGVGWPPYPDPLLGIRRPRIGCSEVRDDHCNLYNPWHQAHLKSVWSGLRNCDEPGRQ